MKVTEALERFPELTPSPEVREWLASVKRRWIGSVSTMRYDGRGWLVLKTLAGPVPEPLTEGAVEHEGRLLVPLTMAAAQTLRAQRSAHLDIAAERCLQIVERGGDPPPARLVYVRGMDGEELRLEVLWDPDVGLGFAELPGANGTRSVPLDPWLAEALDAFIALHDVSVTGEAVGVLERLLAEHRSAADAVRRSRATEAEPHPRDRRRARRRARAVSVGRGPLCARRPRHVPGRRAGPGQDGRGPDGARGRRRLPRRRRLPGIDEARLGARDPALAAPPVGRRGARARHRPGSGGDHDRQLRGGRRPVRGAHARPAARARRRRVALLQEPAGQAHPGGPPPGRGRGAGRPAPGARAGRRCSTTPRSSSRSCASSGAWRSSAPARASPASSAAWSPRSGCTGTCAAPASCAGSSPRSSPSFRPSARWSSRWRSTTSPSTAWPSAT